MKKLIINADDFGFSHPINKGIIEAFTLGVVTDTTILIHSPFAREALSMAHEVDLPVGIHIDFVSEFSEQNHSSKAGYLGPQGRLVRELFIREYQKKIDHLYSCEELITFRDEIRGQVDSYLKYTGSKPSHLDYHFGLHYLPDIMAIYITVAEEYGIPVRWGRQYAGINPYRKSPDLFCDHFRGTPDASISTFLSLLQTPWDGVMELCCHPGYYTPNGLPDSYNKEREYELAVLTNPGLLEHITALGIQLVNYNWLNESIGLKS
jgi:chitin disaccharide deacetylase